MIQPSLLWLDNLAGYMRQTVNRLSAVTPDLEWAPLAGLFQSADLTGLRGCSSSKRLGLR